MEKNSVLRKVSPGEGSLPAGILEGRRKSRPSPSEPLQLYLLIGTPLGEEPQSSPQNATAPSTVGPHVVALICLGKVVLLLSRGRRRVKKGGGDQRSPAHVFHMVILIFQRDLCSPPSFPLCPVGRSTAAKKKKKNALSAQWHPVGGVSVPSGNGQHSISLVPTSAWKARATSLSLFQTRSLASKTSQRVFFIFIFLIIFFKMFVLSILFPQLKQSCCFLVVEYQKDTKGLAVKHGGA